MRQEIWKDIPGYIGKYQVSNNGKVKSLTRTKRGRNRGLNPVRERILKPCVDKDGYLDVVLCADGQHHKHFSVHRLVALTFLGNPDNLPEVDHIDGNRLNNRQENLRFCTRKENGNNPVTRKRISLSKQGENNPNYGKRKDTD